MLLKYVSCYLVFCLFLININVVESDQNKLLEDNATESCDKNTRRNIVLNPVEGKKYRKCCKGFKLKNGECIAKCNSVCENGICIRKNKCECNEGYKILSPIRCIPECSNGCDNGNCIEPEKCDCYKGYSKSDNRTCIPQCDPSCVNAECVSPNKCKCNGSFKFLNNTHCVSENFLLQRDMCVRACDYGDCDDFNQCICFKGYESHNGVCKMTCDKECINGKCLNDQCICDDDFVEFNSTNCVSKEFIINRDLCIAICSNGICLDSNKCLCYQGFKFNKEQYKCLPTCSFEHSNECINGKCVAPNECECLAGYKLDPKSDYQCDPVCENCDNGYCVKPGECACNKGFILMASRCYEEELDLEQVIDYHWSTTTEPAFNSHSTLIKLDDKLSTINDFEYETELITISSFVPKSSTDELQDFTIFDNAKEYISNMSESTTDYNFETDKSTALSIDTSTTNESFLINTDSFEYSSDYYESITNNIVTDKFVTNQEKVGKVTTSNDASFEPTSTATNYYTTSDSEIDYSSYLGITESETTDTVDTEIENTTENEITTDENDKSSLYNGAMDETEIETTSENEMITDQNDSLNTTPLDMEIDVEYLETIEIENKSESDYTENTILGSSSTLNDGSELTINDKTTELTSDHTTSSFYDEESSTLEDIIHETTASNLEFSESSIKIEATSSESSFMTDNIINAESPSLQQESSSNRYNIDETSSNSPSKLMEYSSDDVNLSNDAVITIETRRKTPLNSCEKFCDDGSCTINGECDKESNTLICNCIHGTCIENICICNQGYIISSKNNSMCIREVEVILISGPSEVAKQTSLNPLYWLVLTPLVLAFLIITISILYKLRGPGKSYVIESKEMSENCVYYAKAHSVDESLSYKF